MSIALEADQLIFLYRDNVIAKGRLLPLCCSTCLGSVWGLLGSCCSSWRSRRKGFRRLPSEADSNEDIEMAFLLLRPQTAGAPDPPALLPSTETTGDEIPGALDPTAFLPYSVESVVEDGGLDRELYSPYQSPEPLIFRRTLARSTSGKSN